MIIADTGGLLAFFNKREPAHDQVRAIVDTSDSPLIVSPYVVAEVGYLMATRLGVARELEILSELAGGAYELVAVEAEELQRASRSSNSTQIRRSA